MSVLGAIKAKKCKKCLEHNRDNPELATSYNGLCQYHAGNRSLSCYSKYPVPRKNSNDLYGLEIELKGGSRIVNNLSRFVCADGSVENGGEVKLLGNYNSVRRQVKDTLNRAVIGNCYTDRYCGFHIHFSKVDINEYTFYQLIKQIETPMFETFPERAGNTYCQKINDLYRIYSHYSWINFSNKVPTNEIRIFPGTISSDKALQYIGITRYIKKYLLSEINLEVMKRKIGNLQKWLRANR